MKRKLLMLTALALCLALLCGCTTIATSEWMQNLFPVGDEAVAAQQTGAVNGSEDKQEVKQVVTETYTALESFGLAYQPDYGLQPYNCQSLNNGNLGTAGSFSAVPPKIHTIGMDNFRPNHMNCVFYSGAVSDTIEA